MSKKKKNTGSGKNPNKTPTAHYMDLFNQVTKPVSGEFISMHWIDFTPTEQRLLSYLSDSYPEWRSYITRRVEVNRKLYPATPLQSFVVTSQHNFSAFMRYLLEDLSDEDDLQEGADLLTKVNNHSELTANDLASPHVRGLTKGLDTVEGMPESDGADKFETACYLFTLAYHYLSEQGREQEYYNATSEAFKNLGEFRGWSSNVKELESALKKYKDTKNAGHTKAEKNFGRHKREVIRILEEDISPAPGSVQVKTATALHEELGRRLDIFIAENSLKESTDSARMIKGWAREGEFKELFNNVLASCRDAAIKKDMPGGQGMF